MRWNKVFYAAMIVALLTYGAGCRPKSVDNRAERERQFRDRQRALAIKTYRDLTTKFPDSQYAAPAKERLQALQAQQKK